MKNNKPVDISEDELPPVSSGNAGHLKAFQVSLLARIEAADAETFQARRLGVIIGGVPCLVDLGEAGEIVPMAALPPLTRVPLTQPWYLGLASIRGNLVGISDLAGVAGQPLQPVDRESRVLVFSPAISANCGVMVSRIIGLRDVADMQELPLAPNEPTLPGAVCKYRDEEEREWLQISLEALMQHPAFLHIGR